MQKPSYHMMILSITVKQEMQVVKLECAGAGIATLSDKGTAAVTFDPLPQNTTGTISHQAFELPPCAIGFPSVQVQAIRTGSHPSGG
jgi:hypothetical protein